MKMPTSTLTGSIHFFARLEAIKSVFFFFVLVLFTACGDDDNEVSRSLKFQEVDFIEGRALPQATGFIGSNELNALYIVSREVNSSLFFTERVIKYDLSSGDQKVSDIDQYPDFISKNAHVLNEELIVVGGTRVNTYSLDLDVDPETHIHGLSLSRFGSAIYDDELIVWGGDLSGQTSSHIRKWNFDDKNFETIGEFPAATTWAHGEIVGNKLYSFGGQEQFVNTPITDLIYVYDLQTNETETYFLPEPMSRTFTASFQHKIYVAGHVVNEEGGVRTVIGIFNTKTNKFSPFKFSDLIDIEVQTVILQMTIVNRQLYVLVGPTDANNGVSLQVAKL